MRRKVGVYIETDYGIREALDIPNLCVVARDGLDVVVCRAKPNWSNPDDLALIRDDISKKELTAVVVVSGSPQMSLEKFKFEGVTTERINLLEYIGAAGLVNDEDTQRKAEECILMGIGQC
jgi:heterodisulfide reductase subunit A-like polyferredoxin